MSEVYVIEKRTRGRGNKLDHTETVVIPSSEGEHVARSMAHSFVSHGSYEVEEAYGPTKRTAKIKLATLVHHNVQEINIK